MTIIMVAVGTRTIGVTTDIVVGIIGVVTVGFIAATVTVPGIDASIVASGGRVCGRLSSSRAKR